MITQKEIREIALVDMIKHLECARVSAKLAGFNWVVDDDISTLIEQAQYEYDDELNS
jgi:hypothetical protein